MEMTRELWYEMSKQLDPKLTDERIEKAWQEILARRNKETGENFGKANERQSQEQLKPE